MASNLLIAFPDIPFKASYQGTITPVEAAPAGYDEGYTIAGARHKHYRRSTPNERAYITYDMGSAYTDQAEYFILSRADLVEAISTGACDITLRGSTDNFAASDVTLLSLLNITEADLVGPHLEDVIVTGALSAAYRYFRLQVLDSGNAKDWELGQIYFGQFFDFGRDPSYPRRMEQKLLARDARFEQLEFQFTWNGITDDKQIEFINTIYTYKEVHPVFLYSTSFDDVLAGNKLVYCKITDGVFKPGPTKDMNAITLTFEEMI